MSLDLKLLPQAHQKADHSHVVLTLIQDVDLWPKIEACQYQSGRDVDPDGINCFVARDYDDEV